MAETPIDWDARVFVESEQLLMVHQAAIVEAVIKHTSRKIRKKDWRVRDVNRSWDLRGKGARFSMLGVERSNRRAEWRLEAAIFDGTFCLDAVPTQAFYPGWYPQKCEVIRITDFMPKAHLVPWDFEVRMAGLPLELIINKEP